jgi:hypothetical protein
VTTNAFIFSWDNSGIEAIIPITQYEEWDVRNTFNILKNDEEERNPLISIMQHLTIRAQANPQRHYEIYFIDCDSKEIDEDWWRLQWEEMPQETADMVRERGVKIYSDRKVTEDVIT